MLHFEYLKHNDPRLRTPFFTEARPLDGPVDRYFEIDTTPPLNSHRVWHSDENEGISLEKRMACLEGYVATVAASIDHAMYDFQGKGHHAFVGGYRGFIIRHFRDFPVSAPLDRNDTYSYRSLGGMTKEALHTVALGVHDSHHMLIQLVRSLTKWEKIYFMAGMHADHARGTLSLRQLLRLTTMTDIARAYISAGASVIRNVYDNDRVAKKIPHEEEFLVPFRPVGESNQEPAMKPKEGPVIPAVCREEQLELGL